MTTLRIYRAEPDADDIPPVILRFTDEAGKVTEFLCKAGDFSYALASHANVSVEERSATTPPPKRAI